MFPRFLFPVVVLLISYLALSSPGVLYAENVIEEIRLGKELHEKKNYRKSLTHFLKALESNPNSTQALIGYGNSSLALGSFRDALLSFEKALKFSPTATEAMAGIGLVYANQGKLSESISYLEQKMDSHPNDSYLLLALVDAYELARKTELAVYKLEKAIQLFPGDTSLIERLAKLYLLQGKTGSALTMAERIIQKNPDNLIGFRLLGQSHSLLAYDSTPSSSEAQRHYKEGLNAFQTALVIKKDDELSRYWLAKLMIWKSESDWEEPTEIISQLLKEYPDNKEYTTLLANIYYAKDKLNQKELQQAVQLFQKLLEWNDLDEITRYQAEEFSIRFLSQENNFRKQLGFYRLERHRVEKNSLHYESSLVHLWRAEALIPNHPKTNHFLLKAHKNKSNLEEFILTLRKIIKDDPGNFKAQNKLEYAVNQSKKTLEYQEGILKPNIQNLEFSNPSTLPKIIIMDWEPFDKMNSKIYSPGILKKALVDTIQEEPGIRLATHEEERNVLGMIQSGRRKSYNPYHKSVYFDINQSPSYPRDVRFIGFGKFRDENRSIQIEFQIYDRKTGKFTKPIKLHSQGRSSLAFLTTTLSQKIREFIPLEGNILKVKRKGVVVNLGKKNKMNPESKIEFLRDGKPYLTGRIIQMGDYISLVKPDSLYWERDLATGDSIRAVENQEEDKNKKE